MPVAASPATVSPPMTDTAIGRNSGRMIASAAAQISATTIPYVKIFIVPPSMEILRQRLTERSTDSPREIAKRLTIARQELEFIPTYDYLVVNNELSQAVREVLAIVQAEENRVGRYRDPIKGFLKQENQ